MKHLNEYKLTIVIPFYNEAENVLALIEKIHENLDIYPSSWELIAVDDGSIDDTLASLREGKSRYGDHIRIIAMQRNFGQTAAMQAGIDQARGDIIVTMDGDLQNDPADIPILVRGLIENDLDLLVGWRKNRRDNWFIRKAPSRIANRLIAKITGVHLHDYGCSLKVYRASLIKGVRLYGEMHRFIPAWVAIATSPKRIAEAEVRHHPRKNGKSKYGLSRSFRVIIDLLSVYFFMRYRSKPGHFFGKIGLSFGFFGAMILSYLSVVKFYFGEDIGTRPLLLAGIVSIIAAIQFITTGVIGELMARTYFESTNIKPYLIRDQYGYKPEKEPGWHNGQDQRPLEKVSKTSL